MKKIYLVLTSTGTILSRIVKFYTKDEFGHSSISLDKELQQMYSFGRLNPYNPFLGGFVHEYIDKGTFKRFYKTTAKIYELNIEDEQYEKMNKLIDHFSKNKDNYKFNSSGLFAIALNKRIRREKYFYCAEFVKYILEESGLKLDLPELIRPECFKDIKGIKEIYSGLLQEYSV